MKTVQEMERAGFLVRRSDPADRQDTNPTMVLVGKAS